MARALRQFTFGNLSSVADGAAVNIADLESVYVFVWGTFSATWVLQVSFDGGTTWAQWDTGTAGKLCTMLPPVGHARMICSARVSGTIQSAGAGSRRDL